MAVGYRHPGLFLLGWLLFWAGVPLGGACLLGVLLLILHWYLDERARKVSPSLRAGQTIPQTNICFWLAVIFAVSGVIGARANGLGLAMLSAVGVLVPMVFGLVIVRKHVEVLAAVDGSWLVRMMWPSLVSAGVHAVWALEKFWSSGERATTILAPNGVGTVMLLGLGVGWACIRAWSDRYKELLLAYGLVMAGGAVASGSRGAWIGIAALVLSVVPRAVRYVMGSDRRRVWFGMVGALVCVAGLAINGSRWVEEIWRVFADAERNRGRIYIYKAAWAIFRDHPWFGVGLGTFWLNWEAYRSPDLAGMPGVSHAHNLVLHLLAETGLVGTTLFVTLLGMVAVAGWKARRWVSTPVWVLFLTLGAWLIREQVDVTIGNVANALAFWSLAGLVTGSAGQAGRMRGAAGESPDIGPRTYQRRNVTKPS